MKSNIPSLKEGDPVKLDGNDTNIFQITSIEKEIRTKIPQIKYDHKCGWLEVYDTPEVIVKVELTLTKNK